MLCLGLGSVFCAKPEYCKKRLSKEQDFLAH